jgi:hypothetical protein
VPAGRYLAVHAGDRASVHREDQVALGDPRVLGRRAVEHVEDPQPAPVLLDGHADPLELAGDRLLEGLRLLRREVVGVRIVERIDDALQRGLVERLLADGLVEVVLDRVDHLGAEGAVVLHEGVANRPGQQLRVPAQEDPEHERDERAGECDAAGPHRH